MEMMSSRKNIIIVFGIVVVAVSVLLYLFIFSKRNHGINTDIPTNFLQGTFSINTDNMNELVGDADYVFVGQVVSMDGYVYKYPVMVENENGEEMEISSPYTNYTVNVLENIKGELLTDNAIPIQKAGGLAEDESQYVIYEEDELPEVGNTYIFFTYTQPDGSMLVSGTNSNITIDLQENGRSITTEDNIQKLDEYQKVVDALNSQVITDRPRWTSSYDATEQINKK